MEEHKKAPHTNWQTLRFIVILCFVCAFILGVVAFSLEKPQQNAKEFDQSKQMLIAAKILNHKGVFEILEKDGTLASAEYDPKRQLLVANPSAQRATEEQIKKIAELRIRPLLTDQAGKVYTLEEKNITLPDYLAQNKKSGYANLPFKLFYAILPNEEGAAKMGADVIAKDLSKAAVFVFPVSGFGLWAPIYGYLAIAPDGDTVIGTTWSMLIKTLAFLFWPRQPFLSSAFSSGLLTSSINPINKHKLG